MKAVGLSPPPSPLPSGEETTLADPHVEHPKGETHTKMLVSSKVNDGRCVSCDNQLSLQAGRNYTPVWVYKQ